MRKCIYKRVGAMMLAAALAVQGLGTSGTVFAAENNTQGQTQMSSAPEIVYVNTYNDAGKRTQNFDSNWKFYLGEAGDAQEVGYDDSKWRQISLPHDYSIEQEFSKKMEAESGYLPGGIGWYRKNFVLGEELTGKKIRIDFDGVYMNATVWVNGHQLGTHPYGYTPFSFDITEYVKIGEENTIAVKVNHQTPSSRWYSGSGIYRSVNLTVTDAVHVDLYGVKIATPELETEKNGNVTMNIKTTVANDAAEAKDVKVTHTVFEKGGKAESAIGTVTTEAANVAAGTSKVIEAEVSAAEPKLWSVKAPNLYTVRTEVKVGDKVVDSYDTDYGFRYYAFDKETGFSLNGEKMKLKGVCMHHDQGSLGAVANRRAIERQVEILQNMGCNSIRVTHNPAAQNLIDICNEKGMLVIDEFFDGWMYHKNGNSNDYATWFNRTIEEGNEILGKEADMTWAEFDLKATIGRGENAPSIIMWSLGNEIQEGAGGTGYSRKADDLIAWAKETGTTKLLTIGSNDVKNGVGNNNNEHIQIANKVTAEGGVSGTNYSKGASYDRLHSAYPEWNLLGSETASAVNSRGIYTTKTSNQLDANKQLTSYDKSAVGWGALASEAWYDVITRDFVAGEYVWTGFDYIGEPTPANGIGTGAATAWPSPKNSFFGIIDTAGFPKDSYYLYQSVWNDDVHTLHILPAWNENALMKDSKGNVEVVVYTDAAKVELYLNDSKIATQEMEIKRTEKNGFAYQQVKGQTGHNKQYMTFSVPYAEGTLYAKAYDAEGTEIKDAQGRSSVTTSGTAAKLSASADRKEIKADGKDLTYIEVDVKDAEGNIVPDAANRVKFDVQGEGVLVGVDNGSSPDHDSYKGTSRKAFSGKVLAIVQATKNAGNITVTATSEGLEAASVTVKTTAAEQGTSVKQIDGFEMSKSYYVKVPNKPVLPKEIEAIYTDGTKEKLPVTWDAISDDAVAQSGSFNVKGTVDEKYSVSVNVTMIDEIGGLLNYSAATPAGTVPVLPQTRQAVMKNGEIMLAAFEVDWTMPEDSAFDKATAEDDPVVINGKANVLGQEVAVTANIRVQDAEITLGDSVSSAGFLTQDVPENAQSDTLDAIKDGRTEIGANNDGGPNETAWSNWQNSQNGDNTAEITFRYDTQQTIGQAVVHFARDNGSMRFPKAGTTEIYVSESGAEGSWTKIEAKETIGTETDRVKPYTYDFAPTSATFVKFCLTNTDEPTGTNQKACTAITEIELKSVTTSFVTNHTAALGSLTVNGEAVPEEKLAKGCYYTKEQTAEVTAKGADNAAVTVLPAFEETIKIIIESEDHAERSVFVVYLNATEPLDPSDSSRDYPCEKLVDRVIAGSELVPAVGVEGPKEFVVDANLNNHWHTNWNTNEAEDVEKRWIGFNFEKPVTIDGLRYQPRQQGNNNGSVTTYSIQIKATDNSEWKEVATGTWEVDKEWKIAQFAEVTAKQVRLVGVHTFADSGNDAHMSASGLRVTVSENQPAAPTLESIEVTAPTKTTYETGETLDTAGMTVTAVYSDGTREEIKEGYTLSEVDMSKAGTKTVTVTYEGKEDSFEITVKEKVVEVTLVSIKVTAPTKTTYETGEVLDTTGMTVTAVYSDGKEVEIKEGYTLSEVDMSKAGTKTVTVTYEGKEASFEITVTEKEPENPDNPFLDVSKDDYFYKPVIWADKNEITSGVGDTGKFMPYADCTRAHVVTFLWRAAGSPEIEEDHAKAFSDVTPEDYYYKAVNWAVANEITTGVGDTGKFMPDEPCTRGQIVTFLWRANGEEIVEETADFTDVEADAYYFAAVNWAVSKGITTGVGNTGKFMPNDTCTRAQVVTFLYRANSGDNDVDWQK